MEAIFMSKTTTVVAIIAEAVIKGRFESKLSVRLEGLTITFCSVDFTKFRNCGIYGVKEITATVCIDLDFCCHSTPEAHFRIRA